MIGLICRRFFVRSGMRSKVGKIAYLPLRKVAVKSDTREGNCSYRVRAYRRPKLVFRRKAAACEWALPGRSLGIWERNPKSFAGRVNLPLGRPISTEAMASVDAYKNSQPSESTSTSAGR
jgi:hypothetical protein